MADVVNIPGAAQGLGGIAAAAVGAAQSLFGLGESPEAFYGTMSRIVGRPHIYQASADPGARTFARHMLQAPPLVMIRPGRVHFSETASLVEKLAKSLSMSADDVKSFFTVGQGAQGSIFDMQSKYGATGEELKAIQVAIREKQLGTVHDLSIGNTEPIRYFEFKPALDEYMSVLATLSARIYSRMTSKATATAPWLNFGANSANPKGTAYGGFTTFWADNATSVSESASSEVGATAVAGIVKGIAEKSREAQFFLGEEFLRKDGGNTGYINDAVNAIAGSLGRGSSASDPRTTGIAASLGDAILGINPMFPEVWKDSAFSRSYDLSFKFHSPYGTPGAVYQNVLLPFTQLLSLVLPVLRNPGTYSEPFVFQLDCPGHFSCDLGICTDFTFVKGGPDHLWTKEGLPRQIDVTMRVKDLYPTLAASQNNRSLYCNVGMGTFLDNLAAINLFESQQATNPIKLLQAKLNTWITQGLSVPDRIRADVQNYFAQPGALSNLFR